MAVPALKFWNERLRGSERNAFGGGQAVFTVTACFFIPLLRSRCGTNSRLTGFRLNSFALVAPS